MNFMKNILKSVFYYHQKIIFSVIVKKAFFNFIFKKIYFLIRKKHI